jgi:hypothetical protein
VTGDEGNGTAGDLAFLKEAIASLKHPSLALPMLLAVLGLMATMLLMRWSMPTHEQPDHTAIFAAYAAYLVVEAALAIAILRILNDSPRPWWSPDWSAWAYGVVVLSEVAITTLSDSIATPSDSLLSWLAAELLTVALIAPLAPWFVAIAVERPLAWRPAPYFRRSKEWLPSLLFWNFLILAPAGMLNRILAASLLFGPREDIWALVLLHAILGTFMLFFALALASVAYRRVARP